MSKTRAFNLRIIVKTAFRLARIIDTKVAGIEAGFLAFDKADN